MFSPGVHHPGDKHGICSFFKKICKYCTNFNSLYIHLWGLQNQYFSSHLQSSFSWANNQVKGKNQVKGNNQVTGKNQILIHVHVEFTYAWKFLRQWGNIGYVWHLAKEKRWAWGILDFRSKDGWFTSSWGRVEHTWQENSFWATQKQWDTMGV